MKTAMQTLLDDIEFLMPETYKALNKKFELKKFYLKTEKEQIIEAVQHGLWNNEVVEIANYSKIYYDSTFGDNHEAGI